MQDSAPLRADSGVTEPCLLPDDSVHRTHLRRFRWTCILKALPLVRGCCSSLVLATV